ncbi:cysteine-rich RLK (RECEPTOR-like protein kinase) 42 [Actinidia rufa]|uniref:Cysteine-rich RLK (RECEPTOR-like protein kinase) 42 n=1 Tax=Actinidia rufa TaxID=165716 RepID=A0A7J0ENR3_9ERIC|nr:cysteine-rich RLK (RECEPTOR-like protein kinase) 42 [Actinidia rufa]
MRTIIRGPSWWRHPRWTAAAVATAVVIIASVFKPASADPQTNLLNKGCSQYNATNISDFYTNLNATFADIRSQIASEGKRFATAQQARTSDPVYVMAQCRNYMSAADCTACFDAAVALIRNCSGANGARVIYDGCFLRYESNGFYDQTTLPGNVGICSNRTASSASAFDSAVQGLVADLEAATPRIKGFFAAVKREVVAGGSTTVYAVAQCAETVSESGCRDCLTVAYGNLQSCPPDAEGRAVDAGCFLRYSDTAFFSNNQTTNIAPFLGGELKLPEIASTLEIYILECMFRNNGTIRFQNGSSNNNKAIIGGVVGGGGSLLLILGLILWYKLSRKAKKALRGNILGATELQGPVTFSYKDLKSATNDFSEENKLGEGGFGDVYKGTLKNGNIVAVKKLAIGSSRAKADFASEVTLISNVHHRNILRLLGCCSKGPELLLVYDCMTNGSLDKFLYGERRGVLNWKQRFDIIFGTAKGLAYLHEQFHVCIIHRDIKPSNILLDDSLQPKIADFGLARLLPQDQSHLSTRFAGTLGYTAPEYAIHGQLSEKVDTYSFGVVVLEIISGRRCNDMIVEPVTEYLLEQAWKLYENDMHMNLVDETLDSNEYTEEEMKKVIEIALMCTQSPASSRPTMSEVVVLLVTKHSTDLARPTRPTFIDNDKRVRGDTSASAGSSTSHATASFTEFTGR